MNKRQKLVPLVVAGLFATATLTACSDDNSAQAQQGQQRPAPAVEIITVQPEAVEVSTQLPGRTSAYRVAQVRPQVSGVLLERKFEEGTYVERGQQLYQIDPAVYEAEVASARAEVERTKAVLRSSELRY